MGRQMLISEIYKKLETISKSCGTNREGTIKIYKFKQEPKFQQTKKLEKNQKAFMLKL